MFRSTLVRQVVVPVAILGAVLLTTTTASAEPVGDASLVAVSEAQPEASVAAPTPAPFAAAPPESRLKARRLQFTLRSSQTLDMRGVEPSLYRGKFFRASVEQKRQCVAKRESEGHYDVVSHNGYYGAYQMSPALARGATWMMLPEHRQLLGDETAKRVLEKLRVTPLNKWPRYWQDAAFSTVYNWKHTGSGAAHWRGGRWHC